MNRYLITTGEGINVAVADTLEEAKAWCEWYESKRLAPATIDWQTETGDLWCNGYAEDNAADLRWVVETVSVVEPPNDPAASLTAKLQEYLDAMRRLTVGDDIEDIHIAADHLLIDTLTLLCSDDNSYNGAILRSIIRAWEAAPKWYA